MIGYESSHLIGYSHTLNTIMSINTETRAVYMKKGRVKRPKNEETRGELQKCALLSRI